MNNMIIRVLIINRQLVFAVTIKQALEQTGAFEVHPFTDPNAAVEYLRSHPHDVALVDFDIQVQPGPEIVAQLRAVQPDIALIVSPTQPGTVLQQLNVQDTVDAPFSARGIIPMIERAVEQVSKPASAITRSFVQPDEGGNLITDVLPDERRDPPTEILSSVPATPAGTQILDDEGLDEEPPSPAGTRILDEEGPVSDAPSDGIAEPAQTRILDGERTASEAPSDDVAEPAQTRILDDERTDEEPPSPAGTRILGDEEPDEAPPSGVEVPAQTRILDDTDDSFLSGADDFPPTEFDNSEVDVPSPPTLPEFSSLDNVLSDEAPSALFEPPVRDDDTPAVPEAESGAVRQYLATTSDPEDSLFDDMLSAIPPSDESSPEQQSDGSNFDNLVNSMRAEDQHTPLPDRHQQFVEFILTGGMDHLLTEIEKSHDEPPDLPEQLPESGGNDDSPTDVFQRLIEDEPPMPSLEDSGTIGDLMVGVSDSSFRNVLAMMRGQEVIEEETDEQSAQLRKEIDAAYTAFFEQEETDDQFDDADWEAPPPSLPESQPESEPESAIPAQLILETALDESTPIESFSLNNLIGDIERQLTEHKPDVTPLPSWDIEAFRPKRRRPSREEADELERYIKEPDFLPEELVELSADDESIAKKFSQAENLSEDELNDLGRDLFDEMVSAEARQTATLESQRAVEEDVSESQASIPDEAFVDYDQETVPSASVSDVDEPVFDSPRLPEDEALFDAEEAPPAEAWDRVPDDWDSYTSQEEADPEIETEDTVEGYALLDDEQAVFAQETVIHDWDDEPEPETPDVVEEVPPAVVLDSLWDDMVDEPAAEQADWDDSAPVQPEMPMVDSAHEEDRIPEPSIDESPATPEGVLPESLWDDIPEVSEFDDADVEESEPFEESPAFADDWSLTIDETPDDQTVLIDQHEQAQPPVDVEPVVDVIPDVETFDMVEADNPYVAQIALSLTQMSLELAAEATLITNEEEIVALAGHVNQADVEEIRDAIADDWDANADQARVRFITLPSSNKDYMLYSRKTVGDFTLSMIFAGTTPLRDIRRQGKRLQDALETVPEVIEDADIALELPDYASATEGDESELAAIDEPVDMGALQPYTYLWLLRDPADAFDERRSRMVTTGLGIQLREMGWQIETLQVQDEYVYIRADVPGEDPAYEIINDLKHRVAEIIRVREPDLPADQSLWADSYLVMMPGRDLDPEEISQFISFERML